MTDRWLDPEGHAWPVTGHWCFVCDLPLTPTTTTTSVHPTCQEIPGRKPRAGQKRITNPFHPDSDGLTCTDATASNGLLFTRLPATP